MAERVRVTFGVDACVIRLLEGNELVFLASAGVSKGALYPRIPTTWGVTQEVFSRREPVFVPNVHASPGTTPLSHHMRRPFPFTSYAGAPLIAQGPGDGNHRDLCGEEDSSLLGDGPPLPAGGRPQHRDGHR